MQLSKVQIQEVISKLVCQSGGLNELLSLTLNGLMLSERSAFLSDEPHNKDNGYRLGTAFGLGQQIELRIPRDRMGAFKPFALALLREQESYLREVCFELYSKGLTTKQTGRSSKRYMATIIRLLPFR